MIRNNFKNILTYANSVYQIFKQINSFERKNLKTDIKAPTAIKSIFVGVMCQNSSINEIMETTHEVETFKKIYSPKEKIPKTHGLRDCLIDTPYQQMRQVNKNFIQTLKDNKVFRKNDIDGLGVLAIDATEVFETNKYIKGLPERNHKDGRKSCYHKTFGIMQIGEKNQIMIRMEELKATEVEEIKERLVNEEGLEIDKITDTRMKSEGEITVLKRVFPEIEKEIGMVIDVIVGDALFSNAPVLNFIKSFGKDAVTRFKDERREIYKDAEGLFKNREPELNMELVEITTTIKTKYSKKSKKKNKTKTRKEQIYRKETANQIGEEKIISTRTTHKKNVTRETVVKEKILKKIEVWSDLFDLKGYEYGKIRFVKYLENDGKETQTICVLTTLLNHKLDTILKIMHKRWLIENNGFRVLKTRYNLNHCYVGEINAIRLIIEIIMLVYNIMQMYINVRTKNYRESRMTRKILKKIFENEISNDNEIYVLMCNFKE